MICPRCNGPGWIGMNTDFIVKCITCNGHGELSVEEYDKQLKLIEKGRKQCQKRTGK